MKYSHQKYNSEHMARAHGKSLPISFKYTIEISNALRGKSVERAKAILQDVIALRKAVSIRRFTEGAGHKPGMGPGKYPQKAASHILALLESAESNATFKGLNPSALIIVHMAAQNGGNSWKHGRLRRRKMKRTNLEITLAEDKTKADKKAPAKKKDVKKSAEPKETTPAKTEKKTETSSVKEEKPQADPEPKKAQAPKPVVKETPKATQAPEKKAETKNEMKQAEKNVEKILDNIQRSA